MPHPTPRENQQNQQDQCDRDVQQVGLDQLRHAAPLFPDKIPERKERDRPAERSGPGKQQEGAEFKLRGSRDDRRKVADTGNIIAAEQRPMTALFEPPVNTLQMAIAHVQVLTEAVYDAQAEGPAYEVTD